MVDDLWTVQRILEWIEGYLAGKGDANPRLSAQWLVAEALGVTRMQLYCDLGRPLTFDERDTLRDWTRRRGAGEPLQYLTGSTDFRFITVHVRPGVLIPRPETECLVSEAFAELKPVLDVLRPNLVEGPPAPFRAVDVCTGSGCIAASIATEVPTAHVVATDISPDAVALARENAQANGVASRVQVAECDLCAAVPADWAGRCDLVISNPPYVPTSVVAALQPEVVAYEPALALDGGEDGLDVFRRLLPEGLRLLRPGGVLAVELHETCLDAAADLARAAGYTQVRIAPDLAGRPRVLIARTAPAC